MKKKLCLLLIMLLCVAAAVVCGGCSGDSNGDKPTSLPLAYDTDKDGVPMQQTGECLKQTAASV